MIAPGWHYAQGDPPGTVRYWDGELWQGDFQYQPMPPPGQYQHQGFGGYYPHQYPESSQATTALVLGILGLVVCGVLGPFAWYIGTKEVDAIDAGRRDPTKRGSAQAGRVLGIIVTILLVLGVLALIALLAFASTQPT